MSRHLLLLRHAKSAWDTGAPTDFERPLAPRGRRDAPRMGRWLADAPELRPDLVIASPALRARETLVLAGEALGLDTDAIRWEKAVYGASAGELLTVINRVPHGTRNLLVVGHNPGLEQLVRTLCGEVPAPDPHKLMPTAALAIIEVSGTFAELERGGGVLTEIVRPRDLQPTR